MSGHTEKLKGNNSLEQQFLSDRVTAKNLEGQEGAKRGERENSAGGANRARAQRRETCGAAEESTLGNDCVEPQRGNFPQQREAAQLAASASSPEESQTSPVLEQRGEPRGQRYGASPGRLSETMHRLGPTPPVQFIPQTVTIDVNDLR